MSTLWQDLRYGFRLLVKNPGFGVVAIFTLALGIGGNTAMFSVIHAVLIKPLPYAEPESLVVLWGTGQDNDRSQVSATDIEDYRRYTNAFVDIATIADWTPVVTGLGEAERIQGIQVGDGFFRLMQVQPLLGRTLAPEDQLPGRDQVVVLSYGMWQNRFRGDPNIIGKTVMMSNLPHTVVGVMPQHFQPLPATLVESEGQFYRPVAEPYDNNQRSARHLRAIARLKPGVSIAQAQAEVSALARRLSQEYPNDNAAYGIRVAGLLDDTVGNVRSTLVVLFASVACVLLIACANVANLMLVRSSARQREIAVRAALGASGARLLRQLLTESVLLSLAGGAAGLLLGAWAVALFGAMAASSLPQLNINSLEIDGTVFLFTAMVSILSGLLFGLAPAFATRHLALNTALKEGSGWAGSGRGVTRSGLLIFQVATSLVLLVASGLMLRSFAALRSVDPGFEPEDRLVMNVWLPFSTYGPVEKNIPFYRELLRRVEAQPGVQSAGLVSTLPFRSFDTRGATIEGRNLAPEDRPDPDTYFVSPGYIQAMGIPLRQGRGLTAADHDKAPLVALVNETFARQMWPGEPALGKRVNISTGPDSQPVWREIVGVVGDVRHYALDQPARMQLYIPHTQFPTTAMTLVVHSSSEPGPLTASIRRQLKEMDPGVAAFAVSSMEALISDSVAIRRLGMWLITVFGGLALVLASVGIYGVIAYWVSQRTREVGIRVALGARRSDILGLVMGQGLRLSAIGIALGIPFALGAGLVLRSLLYGVGVVDPAVLVGVATGFFGVALFAAFIPARRAAKVDPMVALRYE